jgi:hypothetical protein
VTREMVAMRREAVHADVVMYEMMLMLQSQRQRHSHGSCMLVGAIDAIVAHRRRRSLFYDIISAARSVMCRSVEQGCAWRLLRCPVA